MSIPVGGRTFDVWRYLGFAMRRFCMHRSHAKCPGTRRCRVSPVDCGHALPSTNGSALRGKNSVDRLNLPICRHVSADKRRNGRLMWLRARSVPFRGPFFNKSVIRKSCLRRSGQSLSLIPLESEMASHCSLFRLLNMGNWYPYSPLVYPALCYRLWFRPWCLT